MKDLDKIGEELFSKLRGRFKRMTIGNEQGQVTNVPSESRFYEFEYNGDSKVSVSLDDDKISVMYSDALFDNDQPATKKHWYDFLKELRTFARKRLLNFDVRDIQKSNLNRRDYKFLAKNTGDNTMTESKLYGTSRLSYQDIDSARIVIKHTESVSENRTQKIGAIYIENKDGERFKYPYKHLNGARAMARHVAEGGNQYDDFGKHVLGLSEELNKLRKFKTYMARSGVMAEGLLGYMDIVNERIDLVKDSVMRLQRKGYYTEAFRNFEKTDLQEVPEDVAGDWIDQLTIRQFNEELKDVFPYIYKLVSEASRPKMIGPDDFTNEKVEEVSKDKEVKNTSVEEELDAMFDETMGQFAEKHDDMDGPMDVKIGPDGALSKMDGDPKAEKPKLPMTEFILTMFDRETGKFPKGETAVLTAVEKDYGEDKIESAKDFIERIMQKYEEVMIPMEPVQEGGMKQGQIEVQDWFEEFNKYKGTNGDDLAQGWIRATLDTGITADAFEENEVIAFNKLKGYPTDELDTSWDGDDHEDFISNKTGTSPITAKMFSTINAIMKKYGLDEEDVDDLSKADDPSYDKPVRGEGNAYAHAVRKAKMNGAKKGDKIDHPDDDEEDITIEKDKEGDMQIEYATDTKDDKDLKAKLKALQDIKKDPNTTKDPELKKELMKRQAELEKDKKAMAAVETLKALAGIQ